MESALIAADVVALPYLDIDQSGILLYAMTAGKAIVASRLEGFVEAMDGREAALFHEPRDVDGLARQLTRLLDDPELRESLGREARALAIDNHSWDAVARRTLEVYEQAAA
jgi:glycosyltransferase involved in cell wall biosynthesis